MQDFSPTFSFTFSLKDAQIELFLSFEADPIWIFLFESMWFQNLLSGLPTIEVNRVCFLYVCGSATDIRL